MRPQFCHCDSNLYALLYNTDPYLHSALFSTFNLRSSATDPVPWSQDHISCSSIAGAICIFITPIPSSIPQKVHNLLAQDIMLPAVTLGPCFRTILTNSMSPRPTIFPTVTSDTPFL